MDKKKKILAFAAVVLVGGLIALSTTGSISNLKSDAIWVSTGEDGLGYWSEESDSGNTANTSVSTGQSSTTGTTNSMDEVSQRIAALSEQVNTLEGDKTREGSILYLQNKIITLQSAKAQIQKDVDTASKNLNTAKALKDVKIDIYACTKDAKYKNLKGYDGNGYVYASPEIYLKRIGDGTSQNPGETYYVIQDLDKQIATETNATTKKTLENKRKLVQDERTAAKLSKVIACYQSAVQKGINADPQIAIYQPKYDAAIAALQKNIDDTTKAQADLADGQKNLPALKAQLLELKKQQDPTYILTLDENTVGSIKYFEKRFNQSQKN